MLLDMNEKISWLKNHNQDPKDKIKKSINNNESPYRNDDNLELEIKHLNQLIMGKDNKLEQV